MSACTFFGHRDCPIEIKHLLKKAIRELIKNSKVKNFYVGNHGDFDKVVLKVLKELKKEFPEIIYSVVLAYIPIKTGEGNIIDYSYTIIPEGIENIPKRFAISYRNKWMVNNSDFVIAYVKYNSGGAAQFVKYAKNQKKTVINIAEEAI